MSAPVGLASRAAAVRAAAPRYLILGVLALLLLLGLRSLFYSPSPASPARAAATADAPSRAFALQFARAYLSYDAERPAVRGRALAPFLSDAVDADAGFFASGGSQEVVWVEVASDQPALTGGRAITIAAAISTEPLPVYLTVTVAHERGGPLSLVGYPAFVGAPAVSRDAPSIARSPVDDEEVTAVVARALRNYLAGSAQNLKADLAPGAAVTLPTLPLRVRSVGRVEWLGRSGSRAVLASVEALDARGGAYTLAYELGIEIRDRPYVDFIEVIPTSG
ncbi:MAG TPA: conjugal transfer protein [Solirubrobacterales bacterium]|nr:conjugal transfer protein [Solirubrobacterales bacterium]